MIKSMTAFARRESRSEAGVMSWELRSVNQRFLDIGTRLPEEMRFLEPQVRELIGRYVSRGKLECQLRYQPGEDAAGGFSVNEALARQLAHASRQIDSVLYSPAPVSSMELMKWPGVLQVKAPDMEQIQAQATALLEEALEALVEARAREGAGLQQVLEQRRAAMQQLVDQMRQRLPEVRQAFRDRIGQRLGELKDQLDAARLEQEVVLLVQKADIDEELDRLQMHLDEAARILAEGGSCGRRLDFLMQEFNREANTIASKSPDRGITAAALELKVLIEQAREQVQNIE